MSHARGAPELLGKGITVTTIAPGLTRTGSFLNAFFKGKQEDEAAWFGVSSSLPLVSMSAERAASQIVEATRRGASMRLPLPWMKIETFLGRKAAQRLLQPAASRA